MPGEPIDPAEIHRSSPGNQLRRLVPGSGEPPSELCDHAQWARSKRNALCDTKPLGWAEVTHSFHPLLGQRFEILKTRRHSGIETLIVKCPDRGTFAISREWTDKAAPSPYENPRTEAPILDFQCLLALSELVEKLAPFKKKGVDNG